MLQHRRCARLRSARRPAPAPIAGSAAARPARRRQLPPDPKGPTHEHGSAPPADPHAGWPAPRPPRSASPAIAVVVALLAAVFGIRDPASRSTTTTRSPRAAATTPSRPTSRPPRPRSTRRSPPPRPRSRRSTRPSFKVLVANASQVKGSAGNLTEQLASLGYPDARGHQRRRHHHRARPPRSSTTSPGPKPPAPTWPPPSEAPPRSMPAVLPVAQASTSTAAPCLVMLGTDLAGQAIPGATVTRRRHGRVRAASPNDTTTTVARPDVRRQRRCVASRLGDDRLAMHARVSCSARSSPNRSTSEIASIRLADVVVDVADDRDHPPPGGLGQGRHRRRRPCPRSSARRGSPSPVMTRSAASTRSVRSSSSASSPNPATSSPPTAARPPASPPAAPAPASSLDVDAELVSVELREPLQPPGEQADLGAAWPPSAGRRPGRRR